MTASILSRIAALAAVLTGIVLLPGCDKPERGPIAVSAIGAPPALRDPNQGPVDPPAAFLAETAAQGLVRFDASGQIVPALAQRWIVSDDGLRYTFRLGPYEWAGGGKITAAQVVARFRAAMAPASRNRLKPALGAIEEVVAMTDDVLEISLKGPRPNFLQLLAQPEMAITRNDKGSGPYLVSMGQDGVLELTPPKKDQDDDQAPPQPSLRLRGESAALAIVRFRSGRANLVTGGTAGDLLLARVARLPAQSLRFDPVSGLLGLAFMSNTGPIGDAAVRDALNMAIDRAALVADMGVPGLQPRASLLPAGTDEIGQPATPSWAGQPMAQRRQQAAQAIATAAGAAPLRLRIAIPPGFGYQIMFAHLRHDWRLIGVNAEAVALQAPADLKLIDQVAPVTMASWYLRNFTCADSAICSVDADQAMDAARVAPTRQARQDSLTQADALLRDITPFIPLTAPVRWSLVSPRLIGFQPSIFGLHPANELVLPPR
jgi:peptide/nickel transport system substrate-binding protein